MSLAPGTRLGVYEITALLGEGGMGRVYRATDTRLKRQVAIKILPAALATDGERLARFQREAEVLAALNHPHIAAIYRLEEQGGVSALVMEMVDGEDLSQRIARGPIPLDEALPLARQIAEALDAAHEQGIIHRDLKPANVMVRPDGVVKVLDFGLAKLAQPELGAGADVAASPTITSPARMTGIGVILGTAAYMSPEQAKGREADRRSDIWAFGVVLYEMLTGRRAFDGEDMAEVLGAVVRLEPNWEVLPADVTPPVRTLLQSCLAKDRGRRVADISTALFVLDKTASLAAPTVRMVAEPQSPPPLWRRVAMPVAGTLVAATVVGTGVWFATRATAPLPPRVSRLQIALSGPAAMTITGLTRELAITPDGSRLVYVGNNGTQLFVRALDALKPETVFTGEPAGPFVSPDGQWIGFVDGTVSLKKVAIAGGPAVTLAPQLSGGFRGATWGSDETIIVATADGTTGLLRVAASGGPAAVITRPDRARGEADHLWPELLPGGRAVLFTVTAATGGLDAAQVILLNLDTGTRTMLVRGGSHARYVASGSGSRSGGNREGGHLVYVSAGALWAAPFDLARLEMRGTPVLVVPEVATTATGGANSAVAGDGTLAYVQGGGNATGGVHRTLVWVDRQGRETPIQAPPRAYLLPRLSPDGKRVAVYAADQELDIWLWDLGRPTLTRVTFDPATDAFPTWTVDGRLIFSSERAGARNLFESDVDRPSAVERLTDSPNPQHATAVSPDGQRMIFIEVAPNTAADVMQLALDGTGRVTPLVQSPFIERNGVVSPDGRWLAYEANDSGSRFEITVRPFPDVNRGHWQVSTAGGTRPLWSRDGRELFYVAPGGALMRVAVAPGQAWGATTPTLVVKAGYMTSPGGFFGRTYDIAPDGQRFLMIKEGGDPDQRAVPPSLVVVLNWVEELKRLVPTPK